MRLHSGPIFSSHTPFIMSVVCVPWPCVILKFHYLIYSYNICYTFFCMLAYAHTKVVSAPYDPFISQKYEKPLFCFFFFLNNAVPWYLVLDHTMCYINKPTTDVLSCIFSAETKQLFAVAGCIFPNIPDIGLSLTILFHNEIDCIHTIPPYLLSARLL